MGAAKDIFHLDNRKGTVRVTGGWSGNGGRGMPFVPQKFISALRQFAMLFVVI